MAVVFPSLVHAKEGSPVFRPDLVIILVPAQNSSVRSCGKYSKPTLVACLVLEKE